MKRFFYIFALLSLGGLSCATIDGIVKDIENVTYGYRVFDADHAERFDKTMGSLASGLASNLKGYRPNDTKVVVTTFTPEGRYDVAESFGKVCERQMMVKLAKKRFRVIEARKATGLYVRDNDGIFSLSGTLKRMTKEVSADLVLAGTYAYVDGEMVLNAVLLTPESGEIVSSATEVIGVAGDPFIEPMVKSLENGGKNGGVYTGRKAEYIGLREPVKEGVDSSHKIVSMRIDKLAEDLARNMESDLSHNRVIVASFVDTDRFTKTGTLGRYLTEGIMHGMAKRGFRVLEVRTAKELMIQPGVGEQALTREVHEMMSDYEADAIVLGTYKRLGDRVAIFARMVVAKNQEVVSYASAEFSVGAEDKFMQSLLGGELERISIQEQVEGF